MNIYSPSQTATYSRCPVKRQLASVERWVPRVLGKREIAACLGRGVAAGLGTYYTLVQATGACPDPATSSQIASTIATQSLRELRDLGCQVPEYEASSAATLGTRAADVILNYAKWDRQDKVLSHDWQILHVEHSFPEHGNARLDLGVDDGQGPAVLDWKTRGYLKGDMLPREVAKYENAGQLLHYSWAYAQFFGREYLPRYYVGLIVLQPRFFVEILPYTITEEDHRQWLRSAQVKWEQMAVIDNDPSRPIAMADEHTDNYGDCEFRRACFTHHWDPASMTAEYVRRP